MNVQISYAGDEYYSSTSKNITVEEYATIIELAANKTIVSYKDNETSTITAIYQDTDGKLLPYEVVRFRVFDSDNNCIDTEYVSTDVNGEATFTYIAQGLYDVTIVVDIDDISSNMAIEDCWWYYNGELTNYLANTINLPQVSGSQAFTLDFDCIKTSTLSGTSEVIEVGNSTTGWLGIGFGSSADTKLYLYERKPGTNAVQPYVITGNVGTSVLTHVQLVVLESYAYMTVNNTEYALSNPLTITLPLEYLVRVGYKSACRYSNLKIKNILIN